jgi:hypothetical protein
VTATTTDFPLARLWRDCLESAGIQARIFGEHVADAYPSLHNVATVGVVVLEEDAVQAAELLEHAADIVEPAGPDVP